MESGDAQRFGALRDLKIIDLTQLLSGPYATMMLADQGAQVIKIEPPEGEICRAAGPFRPDDELKQLGGYFHSIGRNKESVVLDLKTEEGKAALIALVRDADAIVENFRSGVMDRLGLSYETLRAVNPRLVYGSLRGFGDARTGASPYADWPAFDVVAQAMGGIIAITGPDAATPTKVGPGVGDIVPGMFLAFGVLAAIHHARSTGVGQFVDVAMADAVLALCERTVWQNSVLDVVPGPEGNHHPFFCPFGVFPALDGFVTIATMGDSFFKILCDSLGTPELLLDDRYTTEQLRARNRIDLIQAVSDVTRSRTKAELKSRLGGRIPFSPIMNIAEIIEDPHFASRDMIIESENPGGAPVRVAGVPIKMTVTPGGVHRRSPLLGENTITRLREAGLSDKEIQAVMRARAADTTAKAKEPVQ
jgi:crotonobetainyl-CoA:carnitine CoA-transferase CaiB-like acyl-CoA transferase